MALNQLPDFSYKSGVPNELVAAYQQKAQQEEQMRMNQEALKQQKIKTVQDTFTAGAGVVSNIMEFNKQKQMVDAQQALTGLFSRGSEQEYAKSPEYRQELQSLVTKAFPKEAGKEAAEAAFAQLNPKSLSQKGTYQQSGLEVAGPDGRPVTVATNFDTTTGKHYNPITGQEVKTPEDLKGLLPRGYAQSTRGAGYTAGGQEVVADARSGKKFVYDEDGELEEYTGKIYPRLENIPSGIADALSELTYSQEVLGRIKDSFDPKFVGPIAARAGKISQYVENLTDEQRVEFYGNVAEYKNSIIKAITGAQMSELEAKRIIQQIQNENASPKAFMAGLERASKATQQRLTAKEKGLGSRGYITRREVNPEALSAEMDKKLGLQNQQSNAVPQVGSMYNGAKVLSVKRIK
jgi:hypothetical protein